MSMPPAWCWGRSGSPPSHRASPGPDACGAACWSPPSAGPPPGPSPPAEGPPTLLPAHGRSGASDGVVELHDLVIGLFGELQPHEQSGENGERDDDQRREERADADEKDLDRLHSELPDSVAPVFAGAGLFRCSGADSIIANISSRVNSDS